MLSVYVTASGFFSFTFFNGITGFTHMHTHEYTIIKKGRNVSCFRIYRSTRKVVHTYNTYTNGLFMNEHNIRLL